MNTEQRAIELLASMYDEMPGFGITARLIRDGLIDGEIPTRVAVSAIIRALTAAFQHPEFLAQAVPEWLPIDSAPKDGSEILLADSDSVTSGFYHDGSECYGHRGKAGFFCEEDRGNLLTASNFHATHWRPLPEPPRASLGRLLGEEG